MSTADWLIRKEVSFMGLSTFVYLRDKIREDGCHTDTASAFFHGQVLFARFVGLITAEQADELSSMIPEY